MLGEHAAADTVVQRKRRQAAIKAGSQPEHPHNVIRASVQW